MDVDLERMPIAAAGKLGIAVPTIDLKAAEDDVVAAIADACREWGFFQVVNHGIEAKLIAALWREAKHFFALPSQDKEALLRTRDNPWGYYHNELTKNRRDKKEVFDFTVEGVDPIYQGQNRWPLGANGFRSVMLDYLQACEQLVLRLLDSIAAGFGLSSDVFDTYLAPAHTGFVRLNYYPVQDPLAERIDVPHLQAADRGVHHHTDAGLLTVLLQDQVGGLQVFREGCWHDVRPVDGALVINTADMLQVWSNDAYQAAIHRVLAMRSVDRYSVPFFFNPSADAVIEPFAERSRPARYRPLRWSEFRRRRTDGDYADYGTEVQISQYRLPAGVAS